MTDTPLYAGRGCLPCRNQRSLGRHRDDLKQGRPRAANILWPVNPELPLPLPHGPPHSRTTTTAAGTATGTLCKAVSRVADANLPMAPRGCQSMAPRRCMRKSGTVSCIATSLNPITHAVILASMLQVRYQWISPLLRKCEIL